MAQPKFQQRDHIYTLGPPLIGSTPQFPNETPALSSIASGAQIIGLPVTLDKDAPWVMRSRALRTQYDSTAASTVHNQLPGINGLMVRFTGWDHHYLQQDHVPQNLDGAYFGQYGNWKPVYPGVAYPAGGSFLVDIINNSTSTITNLTLYFRGVKLFPWGVRPDYRYPNTMASLPYSYPINPISVANPYGLIQSLGVSEYRQRQRFQVLNDADYVIRGIQAGPGFNNFTYEVFLQLMDEDLKPYSTGWVHLDVLAGQSGLPTNLEFPIGAPGNFVTAVGTGASAPGLFYPEIYVPKNQFLYYDILRADSGFTGSPGAVTQDYPITWIGAKVFDRS